MALLQSQGQRQGQKQAFSLTPRQQQQVRLLAKSIPELREELYAEMNANPVIESIDSSLETPASEIELQKAGEGGDADYPEDDFTPEERRYDEEALERRQAMFDSATVDALNAPETLQRHLMEQIPFSDIAPADRPLAEALIGELDGNGYFQGSLPDLMMSQNVSEAKILATLAEIRTFDPEGCGARTAQECLAAQLDKLDGSPLKTTVELLVERHLVDIAAGRFAEIAAALKISREQLDEAVKLLRSELNPRPGAAYPSEAKRVEYINPEVHITRRDGVLRADTDARSLPEIRISPRYLAMLEDPKQSEETKTYVRGRIEAAETLREAVKKRQELVSKTAEEILERQRDFFESGAPLKPFTETELADKLGVDVSWVSRTVNGKYASTPQGTMELRRFFVIAAKTASGEEISRDAAMDAIADIVECEEKARPLSDEAISAELKKRGYTIARRTVAKYRDRLGIPGTAARRN